MFVQTCVPFVSNEREREGGAFPVITWVAYRYLHAILTYEDVGPASSSHREITHTPYQHNTVSHKHLNVMYVDVCRMMNGCTHFDGAKRMRGRNTNKERDNRAKPQQRRTTNNEIRWVLVCVCVCVCEACHHNQAQRVR